MPRGNYGAAPLGCLVFMLLPILFLGFLSFWEVVAVVVAMAALLIAAFLSLPQCPACKARGTLNHRHTRVDGGPDRRYRSNPLICSSCGASFR